MAATTSVTRAEELKAEGNAAFKAQEYSKAVQLYSQCLSIVPDSHVYLSNRSAAHLSMGHTTAAIKDAEAAVAAKPTWVKGYKRMGAALSAAGRLPEAVATYKRALKIDPLDVALSIALGQATVAAAAAPPTPAPATATAPLPGPADEGGDDDALGAFFGQVEALVASGVGAPKAERREYLPGAAAEEVGRLTGEHAEWANLDPLLVLGLPRDFTDEELKHHYRKLSAVVHPDKCRLPGAGDAFEAVKAAYQVLGDEERRVAVLEIHQEAEEEAARTIKRLRKRGAEDVPPLPEEYAREAKRRFAAVEAKKRKFEKRLAGKAARDAEEEATAAVVAAEVKADDKVWEETRKGRFSNWQGFKGGGVGKKRRLGGIKNDSIRYGIKASEAAKADVVSAADEGVFKSKWR